MDLLKRYKKLTMIIFYPGFQVNVSRSLNKIATERRMPFGKFVLDLFVFYGRKYDDLLILMCYLRITFTYNKWR